jgi:uncharacterized protein (DUF736 family)
MNIGSFTLAKDGGWIGSIRTLTLDAKLRLVPNDDRASEKAPAFRVLIGNTRIGDAWEARTTGDTSKIYLRLRIDDPSLLEPMSVALFPTDEGDKARLVWNRRKPE